MKWRKPSNPLGVPVWEHAGILCTGEIYKDKVKLTFMRGAFVDDPSRLFNAGLDGGTRRAIDFHEGEAIDEDALAALIPRGQRRRTSRSAGVRARSLLQQYPVRLKTILGQA